METTGQLDASPLPTGVGHQLIQGEDAITLGCKLFDEGVYSTLQAACSALGAPYKTACHRFNGRKSIEEQHQKQRALTPKQELILEQEIIEIADWGFPMTHGVLREFAQAMCGRDLGINWGNRYIKRRGLSSIFAPTLDRSRAFNHDPKTLSDFIQLVRTTERKYSIKKHHKWNMDEKGVLLGQAHASRVIIPGICSYRDKRKAFVQQLGTRELVSILEAVNAAGGSIDPLIVFKAQHHQEKWLDLKGARRGWSYATSQRGWTDNELALEWLRIFEKETKPDESEYRLLILDNHGSHVTAKFLRYAFAHRVVLLAFPPHCTHLFQPLDVGLFSPLQNYYSQLVRDAVRWGGQGRHR